MAKKRKGRKGRRTPAQKRATAKMLQANRAKRGTKRGTKRSARRAAKRAPTPRAQTKGAPTVAKRKSSRRAAVRKAGRKSSRRGMAALPLVASLGGAAVTVGGLYALKKWVESKQKADPKYVLPDWATMAAPAAGALALLAADRVGKVAKVRPFVGPALAAAAAFILAAWLNRPKANGAGARRLTGSGAAAARATLGQRNNVYPMPSGAGASAARASLARA